jgi:phage terminase large subunit
MSELKIDTTITFQNAWDCKAKIQLHQGSARSGKSYALIQFLIVKAISETLLISIVRKTFPALRTSALRDFKDIMKGLGLWDDERWMATEKVYTFDNDSQIEFFSTDSAEKLKGLKRDILWVDEANELSHEQMMQLAIRTTSTIILSFNPSFSPKHYIISELSMRDDCELFITTYKDNPYLPEEQVKFIERYKDTNPRYWMTYGLGQFAVNEKQIYDFEIVDEFDFDTAEFVCFAMDIGYVSDPTALVGIWKSGDRLIVNEHLYQKGLITQQILDMLKGNVGERDILIVDSAEPRLIDEIKRGGFPLARGVKKGKDSIQWGIDLVKQYRIVVPKVNTNLIEELYSYEWVDDGNGGVTNIPVDANNHLLDALRYGVMEQLNAKKINAGKYAISIGRHKY